MSYQVLARKWRPRTFASLVGQEHVVKALTHALEVGRLHHAYLFTGTRGVGKTTIARILAKSLNCEQGLTPTPCGKCSSCEEIDAGRFVDLLEVDAATNTRVDEMRQLLENAVYAPTRGRYKVYVIDEVHMLSNSAFNAMLKTLEEPPEHVKFILATTDPQKIPVTVLSRCLQFNLKQMSAPAVSEHLRHILEQESVECDKEALALIARAANGSMRDALSLLDQSIAHGVGQVRTDDVRAMLGTVDRSFLFDLLSALAGHDIAGLLTLGRRLAELSLSFDSALQELSLLLTQVQVAQLAPGSLPLDDPDTPRLQELAARFDPEYVQLAYQIVIHGRQELPLAPEAVSGFEMLLLRLSAFSPQKKKPEHLIAESALPRSAKPASVASVVVPEAVPPVSSVEPLVGDPVGEPPLPARTEEVRAPAPIPVVARTGVVPPATESVDWEHVLGSLALAGLTRELAHHCELRLYDGDSIALRLSPAHRHLQMRPAQDKLQQALSEYFQRSIHLRVEVAETESATPAANAERGRQERQDAAIAAIEKDGFVREVIEMFDATLIESSIKPL